jgi:hypothetical protein
MFEKTRTGVVDEGELGEPSSIFPIVATSSLEDASLRHRRHANSSLIMPYTYHHLTTEFRRDLPLRIKFALNSEHTLAFWLNRYQDMTQ